MLSMTAVSLLLELRFSSTFVQCYCSAALTTCTFALCKLYYMVLKYGTGDL